MKDLKKRIVGIMIIIVCSLLLLGITLGSEVIPPVPVSDESVEVKFTEKKKEKKEYFFLLKANCLLGGRVVLTELLQQRNQKSLVRFLRG